MTDESVSNKLTELFDLYKSGALTKEEYETLKSELINQTKPHPVLETEAKENTVTNSENRIEPAAEESIEPLKEDARVEQQIELNNIKSENKEPVITIPKPKRRIGHAIIVSILLIGIIAIGVLLFKSYNENNKLSVLNSLARTRIAKLSADSLIKSDSISTLYGRLVEYYSTYGSNASSNIQIPLDGLIAYFPFNANANDESGNGYHGTVVDAILTSDRFGNSNSAYRFDGNSGEERYIFSNIGNYNTLSFSVWFKSGTPTTMYPDILNYGSGNRLDVSINGNHSSYIANGSIGKIAAGAVMGGTWSPIISSNIYVADNQWHHIVICYVPNDYIYLYVDKISLTKASYSPNNPTDDLLYIGRQINDNAGSVSHETHFDGSIDDIRIYNRKLTDIEISNLFNEKNK